MYGTNLTGARCRAKSMLRSHRGMIQRSAKETIEHDIDNLGRRLISVRWDVGIVDYVFPSEIGVVEEEAASH